VASAIAENGVMEPSLVEAERQKRDLEMAKPQPIMEQQMSAPVAAPMNFAPAAAPMNLAPAVAPMSFAQDEGRFARDANNFGMEPNYNERYSRDCR
jgi:hypothetical protein